ncbi:MAG: YncE family protein [Ignavibacteriales bacterium]|nr:YncE family protein [Ignavibacteriales bacterium]
MKNISFQFLVVIILLCGCKDDGSITTPTDPDVTVSTIYGVGVNQKSVLSWNVAATSHATRLMIYRHTVPLYAEGNATHIAEINLSSTAPTLSFIVDSTLTNGTTYYYTIVPEALDPDGGIKKGEYKTTAIIPFDPASVPTSLIKYSEHIQPIFNGGCAMHGCHEGASVSGQHKFRKSSHGGSTFSLISWANAMFGTDDVAQIVPYRARKSHIIQHVNSDTAVAPVAQPSMPPGFTFPAELRDLLVRWVDDGAKNDDGTVAYSTMPVRGWGYVTNQGEDITAVIDLDKNKIARYITTGVENTVTSPPHSPHNVVVDWQNQYYYVNLIGGNKLLKFRVTDNAKAGELSTGLSSPAQVALSRNGDTAYVSNFENGKTNISLVYTPSMTKISDLSDPAMLKPHGISITPDFKSVLVMNSLSDNISIVRTSDNTMRATIPVSGNVPALPIGYVYQYEPYQAAITPDSKYAFITCRKSGEVRVLDIDSLRIVDSIKVGTFPLIPAITPDGQYVFVANRNSNSVSAIKVSTRTVEYSDDSVGVEPHGIAVSKDGKYLYVSCENLGVSDPPHHPTIGAKKVGFVKIIEIATRSVIASLEVGNFGSGMAVTH